MAKVYVSSTIVDLKPEREAVMDWLVAANHQPVHSYRPNSETIRESCLDDVDGCDLYVLILGHRYGFQPEENNPERLSITHLEFRRAKESKIPRIALLRTSVPNFALSDLGNPSRAALVLAFIAEVQHEVRPAEFSDLQKLIEGLSTGVQGELERIASEERRATGPGPTGDDPRVLRIMETLAAELERKNKLIDESSAENLALRGQVTELQDQLRAAIARTLTAADQPGAGAAEKAAVVALEAGDTRPAEALLKNQENEEVAQIGSPGADDQQQRAQAAALAREQGALAMGHDVRAALDAFQRVVEYEPDDTWAHFVIGDLQVGLGNLNDAMQSFRKGIEVATALVARDSTNTEWQHDLSAGYDRIGDVLVARGDGPGALAAYRKGLAIRDPLAACDPANTLWQRDLSVSHNKIGDVLVAQRDGRGALAAYRKDLTIAEALAARDPANTEWQRDLSVSHDRIGNVLLDQGDGSGALAAYRDGFAIREALARRDPANIQWQHDLSVSHEKIGDALVSQGERSGALAAYREGFAIREVLAERDPANTRWQRDLSISHERIGDVLAEQGDGRGALAAYRKDLAIVEALAARDPANTEWQSDVAFSCAKLGTLPHAQNEDVRREYLLRGREILVQLKAEGRLLPKHDWIAWFDNELAQLPESKTTRQAKSPKPPRK